MSDTALFPCGRARRGSWLTKLPEGERRILQVLIDRYPGSVPRDEVSDGTGYKRSTRDRYLQYMQAKQIVEATGDGVRAAESMF